MSRMLTAIAGTACAYLLFSCSTADAGLGVSIGLQPLSNFEHAPTLGVVLEYTAPRRWFGEALAEWDPYPSPLFPEASCFSAKPCYSFLDFRNGRCYLGVAATGSRTEHVVTSERKFLELGLASLVGVKYQLARLPVRGQFEVGWAYRPLSIYGDWSDSGLLFRGVHYVYNPPRPSAFGPTSTMGPVLRLFVGVDLVR